ncbi:hypothetical protein [Streptococcus sp. sy004]|uniref:hypothetical protein n=1 Tax=Streptococcus sp. sy004 TaxID=2600149 RepID=UPI0011B368A6|nr:hypothetical protein [Streptococcus sp. sy004]TWT12072.1 hypothetical protein FRX54_00650 [Streptococcus sp. sy004]
MRVRTKQVFRDLKEKIIRQVGDEFDVSEERLAELEQKLPGFIEVVDMGEPVKKGRRTSKKVADDGTQGDD